MRNPPDTPGRFTDTATEELPKGNSNARARTREATDGEFEAFYEVYPREEARGAARKTFAAARKKASTGQIMDGLDGYLTKIDREQTARKYIASPASWLNGERWADMDEPPPRKLTPWDDEFHKRQVVGHD